MNRAQWIDTVYPYNGILLSVLPKIRWGSFRYEGPFLIETDGYENDDKEGSTFKVDAHEKTTLYETSGHTVLVSGAPYEVFGGAACELWGKKIPQIPIYKFVDPTGDIDVSVSQPKVLPDSPELQELIDIYGEEYLRPLMIYKDTYTPYGDAFTRWLFNEVVEQVQEIAAHLNTVTTLPRKDEHLETVLGDLDSVVGNLLITRHIAEDKSMIKIQISTKILPDIVHNIMEFILSPHGDFRSQTKFTVDGIYLQGPIKLIQDQADALADRADSVKDTVAKYTLSHIKNSPLFYKFDNHCARVLYLALLIREVQGKRYPENGIIFMHMDVSMANGIVRKLYKNGRGAMCDAHFGDNYIGTLIGILESMENIGPGALKKLQQKN
jgi:hypothetical protein